VTFWQWFGMGVIALLCAVLPWLLWREEQRQPEDQENLDRQLGKARRRND